MKTCFSPTTAEARYFECCGLPPNTLHSKLDDSLFSKFEWGNLKSLLNLLNYYHSTWITLPISDVETFRQVVVVRTFLPPPPSWWMLQSPTVAPCFGSLEFVEFVFYLLFISRLRSSRYSPIDISPYRYRMHHRLNIYEKIRYGIRSHTCRPTNSS